jgi:plastocyanin domain-containing protein
MTYNTNWNMVVGLALGASLLGGVAWAVQPSNAGTMASCQKMMGTAMSGMSCCAPKTVTGKTEQATQGKDVQRATIFINGGYEPSTINVKAGKPLELVFTAKGESCANSVSIPTLGKTLTLKDGEKTTIRFTPKKGTTTFSCEMGMYRGQVIAQ